jgi:hypothetical protein
MTVSIGIEHHQRLIRSFTGCIEGHRHPASGLACPAGAAKPQLS